MNHLDTWTELILAVHVKKNISLLCQAGLFIPSLFEGYLFFLLLVCVHLIFIFNPAAAVLLASGKY